MPKQTAFAAVVYFGHVFGFFRLSNNVGMVSTNNA